MNYTILIVDDDMAINDMLVKYLGKMVIYIFCLFRNRSPSFS